MGGSNAPSGDIPETVTDISAHNSGGAVRYNEYAVTAGSDITVSDVTAEDSNYGVRYEHDSPGSAAQSVTVSDICFKDNDDAVEVVDAAGGKTRPEGDLEIRTGSFISSSNLDVRAGYSGGSGVVEVNDIYWGQPSGAQPSEYSGYVSVGPEKSLTT